MYFLTISTKLQKIICQLNYIFDKSTGPIIELKNQTVVIVFSIFSSSGEIQLAVFVFY